MHIVLALVIALGNVGTVEIGGDANYADPSYGSNYLAMRLPHGTRVHLCGDGGCHTMRVTDFGPVRSTGDIADISLYWFARLCGYYQHTIDPYAKARIMGECQVTAEYGGTIALPPTDVEPVWSWPGGGPR